MAHLTHRRGKTRERKLRDLLLKLVEADIESEMAKLWAERAEQRSNQHESSGVVTPSTWQAALELVREEAESKGWIVPEPKVWMENGVMYYEMPQPRYRTAFRTITTVTIKESDEEES